MIITGFSVNHTDETVSVTFEHRTAILTFDWFSSGLGLPLPDFDDVQVTDGGNTLRLGAYEAAADALFYADEDQT